METTVKKLYGLYGYTLINNILSKLGSNWNSVSMKGSEFTIINITNKHDICHYEFETRIVENVKYDNSKVSFRLGEKMFMSLTGNDVIYARQLFSHKE